MHRALAIGEHSRYLLHHSRRGKEPEPKCKKVSAEEPLLSTVLWLEIWRNLVRTRTQSHIFYGAKPEEGRNALPPQDPPPTTTPQQPGQGYNLESNTGILRATKSGCITCYSNRTYHLLTTLKHVQFCDAALINVTFLLTSPGTQSPCWRCQVWVSESHNCRGNASERRVVYGRGLHFVFRKDKDFVRRLADALAEHKRKVWIDWKDIR